IAKGEVHVLVGENGAGKSTLGKIIAGVHRPDEGRVLIDGEPAELTSPLDAQRHGIAIIFQELDLFPNLTVGENIVIGNLQVEHGGVVDFKALAAFCRPWLEKVGLTCSHNTLLDSLSISDVQRVAIARALSMKARLIIMDEPTSSLPDDAIEKLLALICDLRDSGVSVVYVSHKMDELFRIADRITVLRDGSYVGTSLASETNKGELIRDMVGRDISEMTRCTTSMSGAHLLEVNGLTTDGIRDVSFSMRTGDVLGVAGLVGSGRSEIGAALFGLDAIKSGSITLKGQEFCPISPAHAMDAGIMLLPEDRKNMGLMMGMSVEDNAALSIFDRFQTLGVIRGSRLRKTVEPVMRRTLVKAASPQIAVSTLSGGNQQKVLLCKCILPDTDVLFLDEPTRGVDVGAKEDIYGIIEELAQEEKAILFVSSELPELLRCCDRILVMHEGRSVALLNAAETSQEAIMAMATGQT
ncbi:MAG: sugar ABC transporter ATP-binding protein, partial [Candidatus Hydrogenedentes bacterium]|nr:sugar ABC transporter ATP-binding protein [Candidatus Hydrogenedentota bacterium]